MGCDVIAFMFKGSLCLVQDRSERRGTPEEASSVAQVSWAEMAGLD